MHRKGLWIDDSLKKDRIAKLYNSKNYGLFQDIRCLFFNYMYINTK